MWDVMVRRRVDRGRDAKTMRRPAVSMRMRQEERWTQESSRRRRSSGNLEDRIGRHRRNPANCSSSAMQNMSTCTWVPVTQLSTTRSPPRFLLLRPPPLPRLPNLAPPGVPSPPPSSSDPVPSSAVGSMRQWASIQSSPSLGTF